ncbi:MAG TPA: DUF5317 family protein [Acidimicrobiales bacterium]|jgi:hypothetical protein|nr:DUF5317 family protein [Acidimicrobiales bacterium]
MLLALVAVVAGVLAGLATGRRPPTTPQRWRLPGLIAVGVALEFGGQHLVDGPPGRLLMDVGYATLVVFAALNARRTGLVLIAAGLAANLLVVVVDGGMPVRDQPPTARLAGQHHGLSSRDHLTFLADTIDVRPVHVTFSPGDIVAALGAAVAVFAGMETPDPAPPEGRRRPGRNVTAPL